MKKVFRGQVIGCKVNRKNEEQHIIEVEVGRNPDGSSLTMDFFVKNEMISRNETVVDEATNQETVVPVIFLNEEDLVTIGVMTHEAGDIYTKSIEKGVTYLNENDVEVVSEKKGTVTAKARKAGFNVLSVKKTSFESLMRSKQLYS